LAKLTAIIWDLEAARIIVQRSGVGAVLIIGFDPLLQEFRFDVSTSCFLSINVNEDIKIKSGPGTT
jgi:hypothetical protein